MKKIWKNSSFYAVNENGEEKYLGCISQNHYLGLEYTEKMLKENNTMYYANFHLGNVHFASHPLKSNLINDAKKEFEELYLNEVKKQILSLNSELGKYVEMEMMFIE